MFEWNEQKAARNTREHKGVSFEEAAATFNGRMFTLKTMLDTQIDEGNDEDFGVAEYDFGAHPQSARAAALQAKLRAEAKARLAQVATGLSREEMIEASLKEKMNYDSSS